MQEQVSASRSRWGGRVIGLLAVGLLGVVGWQAYRGLTATPIYLAPDPTPPLGLSQRPTTLGSVDFLAMFESGDESRLQLLREVQERWNRRYTAPMLEVLQVSGSRGSRIEGLKTQIAASWVPVAEMPPAEQREATLRALWAYPVDPPPDYAEFKARLYEKIDPDFAAYFDQADAGTEIRLDEVVWGGVRRDGIPPLVDPAVVTAGAPDADYLDDDDVVFGVVFNGESRAYPKRILAWHEMVRDTVGGAAINGVYCTLCGAMIVYDPMIDGTHHVLGTSGFLYRSNKLMYDHATESLWSTNTGEPVVGPLVGRGLKLTPRTVVTTTWGRWRALHPDTTVLTLETGHQRDYGEGVAYRDYFATDELMTPVPGRDRRLANKALVLALRFGEGDAPLAIGSDFLATQPVYRGTYGGEDYVVLTDASGAHRVYAAQGTVFEAYDRDRSVADAEGRRWTLTEEALVADDQAQKRLRLASHNVFWFGWHAAHPDTQLILK